MSILLFQRDPKRRYVGPPRAPCPENWTWYFRYAHWHQDTGDTCTIPMDMGEAHRCTVPWSVVCSMLFCSSLYSSSHPPKANHAVRIACPQCVKIELLEVAACRQLYNIDIQPYPVKTVIYWSIRSISRSCLSTVSVIFLIIMIIAAGFSLLWSIRSNTRSVSCFIFALLCYVCRSLRL